jgi:hypothetical protein
MKSPLDSEKSSASFEKKYGKYKNTVQPRVISLYSKVDLFPEKRELYVSSEMILQNKSQESISEIMVNYNEDIDFKNFQFSKSGKWILEDNELQFKIYQLDEGNGNGKDAAHGGLHHARLGRGLRRASARAPEPSRPTSTRTVPVAAIRVHRRPDARWCASIPGRAWQATR